MTDLTPASTAKPRPVIDRATGRTPHRGGGHGSRGRIVATIRPNARRIAGWACIALGKAGSLWLAWIVLAGAGRIGPWPVLAATVCTVALGLWFLRDSDA